MKLDWDKIVSNSVTVLVATVFVGAAAKLWSGVESIDSRIHSNLTSIRATQNVLAPKVDKIEEELNKISELLSKQDNTEGPRTVFEAPTKGTFDLINENYLEQQTIPIQRQIPIGD